MPSAPVLIRSRLRQPSAVVWSRPTPARFTGTRRFAELRARPHHRGGLIVAEVGELAVEPRGAASVHASLDKIGCRAGRGKSLRIWPEARWAKQDREKRRENKPCVRLISCGTAELYRGRA